MFHPYIELPESKRGFLAELITAAESVLQEAAKESSCGESVFPKSMLDYMLSPDKEVSELLHYAVSGRLLCWYGPENTRLEVHYLMCDSLLPLSRTHLGTLIHQLQSVYELLMLRFGRVDDEQRERLISHFDPAYLPALGRGGKDGGHILRKILSYDAGEGEVEVCDGEHRLLCYLPGSSADDPSDLLSPNWRLSTFLAESIVVDDENMSSVSKGRSYYSYELTGKKVSSTEVAVGGIVIELDKPFPKDIPDGRFVHFSCLRLDYIIC